MALNRRSRPHRRSAAVVAALALALCGVTTASAASRVKRYALDGWALVVRPDRFTGITTCAMQSRDRRIVYQPGALGFRFDPRRNTFAAWYRIDDGPPQRWQDRYPALVAADAAIDGPALDNPTGGIVWLPSGEVADAQTVRIRANGHGDGRLFRLRGFAAMRAAAERLGCRFT